MKIKLTAEYEKYLSEVKIDNGEITGIEYVEDSAPLLTEEIRTRIIPDHYRISLKLKPSSESDIRVELVLPVNDWNGNFLGTGNGGWAGTISRTSMYLGLCRGFASANTDLGGELDPDALIGKPERWVDFGFRATHLMTVAAKQLIKAFYGTEAKHSYYLGGSTGGQQALREAQSFPADYDGIIAFCPAINRVRLHTFFIWNWVAMTKDPEVMFDTQTVEAVARTVIERYGIISGSAPGDNFLSYPGKIRDSADEIIESLGGIDLKDSQKKALKTIYEGSRDPITGEMIFPPIPLGCERSLLLIPLYKDWLAQLAFFPFRWLFGKEADIASFDFHKDYQEAVKKLSPILDATDANLKPFQATGGKLLIISGSEDSLIPYVDTLNYYKQVVNKSGGLENTLSFCRYFHVPGMGHGTGGAGFQEIGSMGGIPGIPLDKEHDALSAMVDWVEHGNAPERLLPVAFEDRDMKKSFSHDRPVYPYPYETEYVSGDPKERDSFRKKYGDGNY